MAKTEEAPTQEEAPQTPVTSPFTPIQSISDEEQERSRSSFRASVEKIRQQRGEAPEPEPEKEEPETPEKTEPPEKEEPEKQEPEKEEPETEEPEKDEPDTSKSAIERLEEDSEPEKAPKGESSEPTEPDLKPDPSWTKRQQDRFNGLVGKLKEQTTKAESAAKQAEEARKKVTELESRGGMTDDVKQQLEQLRVFKRRFDLENDPEIKSKYADRIEDEESTITNALNETGNGWIAEEATKAGGFDKLLRSGQTFAVKGTDGKAERISADELYKRLLGALPARSGDAIRLSLAEQKRLSKERTRVIEAESKKADEYFTNLENEQAKAQEAAQQQHKELLDSINARYESTITENWIADIPIPQNGDEKETKRAEKTNARRAAYREALKEVFATGDTSKIIAAGVRSIKYFAVSDQLKATQARITELEKELKATKQAGRTTPKPGAGGKPTQVKEREEAVDENESPLRRSMRKVVAKAER